MIVLFLVQMGWTKKFSKKTAISQDLFFLCEPNAFFIGDFYAQSYYGQLKKLHPAKF